MADTTHDAHDDPARAHSGERGDVMAIIIAGIAVIAVMVAAGQSTGGFGHDGGYGARAVSASTVPLPASGYEGAYSTSRVNAWGGLRDGGFGQSGGYGGHRPAHNPY